MKNILYIFLILSSFCFANSTVTNSSFSEQYISDSSLKKLNYLEELANKSEKFHKYCWDNPKELGGCFRASSIMIIGYNQSRNTLAYLHKVQAQAEDAGNIYRLKIQDLNSNKLLLDKKYFYSVDSKEYEDNKLQNIEYFYNKNQTNIVELLKINNISPSIMSFKYIPFKKNDTSLFIGFSTTQSLAQFGYDKPMKVTALNNLVLKKSNKLLFKQNYTGKNFCKECTYPFFLLDPLTIIELKPSGKKILVVGLIAYDFHSPNSLFFQLIGI